jgi:hypothetical protein
MPRHHQEQANAPVDRSHRPEDGLARSPTAFARAGLRVGKWSAMTVAPDNQRVLSTHREAWHRQAIVQDPVIPGIDEAAMTAPIVK